MKIIMLIFPNTNKLRIMKQSYENNLNFSAETDDENVLKAYEDYVNLQIAKCTNQKVKNLLRNKDIFVQHIYDVGKINVEPQRLLLTSYLPVSQRPFRTSHKEEIEINSQIEKLLEAGLIKERNSLYSFPVTLAFKQDEGKKNRLCIYYRKLYALIKNYTEPLPRIDNILDKLSEANFFLL